MADPAEFDDLHFLSDKLAVLQRDRTVGQSGASVGALYYTALLPSTPKLMINVESDDYAVLSERACACPFGEIGLTQHIREVRSYEKLTAEGIHFLGSDLDELVDRVLPARFGGSPTDYQLVEEEAGGLPKVSVVARPALGDLDEAAVIDAVLAELRAKPRNRLMADAWRDGDTVRLVRREPYITAAGKIFPLQLAQPAEPRPAFERPVRCGGWSVAMTDLDLGHRHGEAAVFPDGSPLAGSTPWEEWLRWAPSLSAVQEYDTVDRDLRALGMVVLRVPLEAGVIWRLELPRGEQVEAWEPGTNGLRPPVEIAGLIDDVVAEKQLIPMPPPSRDPGAKRLRAMIEAQRQALLAHDPGTRLGDDPENLHQHRVAARRARAFLRATSAYVDPAWRQLLREPLRALGGVTGPVRDLDVLLEHVRDELPALAAEERSGGDELVARLELELAAARASLLNAFDGDSYRALLTRLRLPPQLGDGVQSVPLRRIARKEFRRLVSAVDELGSIPVMLRSTSCGSC